MGEVTTIGLDIAKSVFQVHGIDAEGAVLTESAFRKPIGVVPFRSLWITLPHTG